ncbi:MULTISPECIES: tetratricopeptide repeat protein [Paracoccus]|uniref:tetratricopeptide repeat protein n=1 Tax=Paracoccus TaxID=265 RepID=UPI0003B4B07B|nr:MULTISPECIES: tetratricopeptide repeat protein [Paracoccus]
MSADRNVFHNAVAALRHRVLTIFIVLATLTTPAAADPLADAFDRLARPTGEGWRIAEADILREWSRSGSASMDVLLQRGEAALDQGDLPAAIGHLTALIDHAPDFAAAYQARAAAFAASDQVGPALADLGRTLELEPRHFIALTQLGAMLEELGQEDRALDAYRASLAIHPHQQEAIDGVARLERARIGTDI